MSSRTLIGSLSRALWSLSTPPHFEAITPTREGVAYRERAGRGIAPLADIYLPEQADGRSLLVIHGGGFAIGSRRMKPVRRLAAHLVPRGIAVCAIDYRMILRGGRLDAQVDDVVRAARWWKQQAAVLGLDPDRAAMMGISAGGALMLLATTDERLAGTPYDRLISLFGIYHFAHLGGSVGAVIPRLLLQTSDRQIWADRSPIVAAAPTRPLLLIHGTDDGLVPCDQALALAEQRRAKGLPTDTLILEDEPHAFLNWPGPAADAALAAITDFLAPTRVEVAA